MKFIVQTYCFTCSSTLYLPILIKFLKFRLQNLRAKVTFRYVLLKMMEAGRMNSRRSNKISYKSFVKASKDKKPKQQVSQSISLTLFIKFGQNHSSFWNRHGFLIITLLQMQTLPNCSIALSMEMEPNTRTIKWIIQLIIKFTQRSHYSTSLWTGLFSWNDSVNIINVTNNRAAAIIRHENKKIYKTITIYRRSVSVHNIGD